MPRDTFEQDVREALGTFFDKLTRSTATRRQIGYQTMRSWKTVNGPRVSLGQARPDVCAPAAKRSLDAADYAVDIEDNVNQQIVSLIKSEFGCHALADLETEILRAEGYTTNVSPPGPDGRALTSLAAAIIIGYGRVSPLRSSQIR